MRDVMQQHRDSAAADEQHQPDEARHLGEGEPEARGERAIADRAGPCPALLTECRRDRRQQDQHDDHQQVLHDKPADDDVAAVGVDEVALPQRAHQHHRAGDRQRGAKDDGADA